MKVFDILKESTDTSVDEGPARFVKRTLFKNTQMGKSAQVSAEIDSEAKKFYKEFMSDVSNYNYPKPTVQNLAKWMVGKKFASSPQQVYKLLQQNPTFKMKLGKVGKTIAKGAGAVASTAKKGADAAVGAAKKVKARLTPEPSKVDPRQGELDLQSMYNESIIINEIEQKGLSIELSKDEVMNVMRGFMKQGREKKVNKGAGGVTSAYADNVDVDDKDVKTKPSTDKSPTSKQIQAAKDLLDKAGFLVTKK